MDCTLTLEHVAPGGFPDWLFEHLCAQTLDPTLDALLVVHSSEAARAGVLARLEAAEVGPIDRSRHHTLASLWMTLHADLRLPRLLPADAAGLRLLHAECEMGARAGAFPVLHPTPEHRWGEGRTRALTRLTQAFDVEDVRRWDGPGMTGFRQRLARMGEALNGVHPLVARRTVIDALEGAEDAPFLLSGVTGIVLMDQMPSLPRSDRRLLRGLLRFRPIHQLSQRGDAEIGNHRLGLHGAILEDVEPSVPEWVPTHTAWDLLPPASQVHRLLVPRQGLELAAATELLRDWAAVAPADAGALIIDPGAEARSTAWREALIEVGLRPAEASRPLRSSPAIHWWQELSSIGVGAEAWSMSRLRGLGAQRSLRFTSEWMTPGAHPLFADWAPELDADRLESLGRVWHILGGHGALSRWLQAMRSPPRPAPWQDADTAGRVAECTQWWLLSLVTRLSPLLSPAERSLLEDPEIRIGCATGVMLPLPDPPASGDAWLSTLSAHLDWEGMLSEAASLQRLIESHGAMRRAHRVLGHSPPTGGARWVEDLAGLIEGLEGPQSSGAVDRVRVMTPAAALGHRADLVLLTHLTNAAWALRAPRLPWLDEIACAELDICRPDAPLRDARHALHHLMHAADVVVLVDATGLDEDAQPASPLAEWLADRSGADASEEVRRPAFLSEVARWGTTHGSRTRGHHLAWRPMHIEMVRDGARVDAVLHVHGRASRDDRQRAGLTLRDTRAPSAPPLRAAAVSLAEDAALMQDRLRRQPARVDEEEDHLEMDLHDRFVGVGDLAFVPTESGARGDPTPREATSWPVLGGKKGGNHLTGIDPRPLSPSATSLPVHDARHGATRGAPASREVWSASRLQRWQACPRQGWLERRLRACKAEVQEEDLDARIRGDLIHGALGAVFEQALALPEGAERPSTGATSLADVGEAPEVLFTHVLDHLGQGAPWLERTDATASQRRHDLIGLDRETWLDWLASPRPMPPSGRLGRMLMAELALSDAVPVAMEWPLDGREIALPEGASIRLSGYIDRVDLIGEENPDGDATVAPLDWRPEDDWRPRRRILIRDIKSVDGPKSEDAGRRHRKALFDELQLGLYARAWEVAHPGDLVIAAGISEIGAQTDHRIEISPAFEAALSTLDIGRLTTFTTATHRCPDESADAESDPFRAWMRERLTTAIAVAAAADAGAVHPTPSEGVCTWCRVQEACGLAPLVGGDRKWN